MNPEQARFVLLKHADHLEDERDNLLSNLRPYLCVKGQHLAEVVAALHALTPELASGTSLDRQVIHSVWSICRDARLWTSGPREPMFHGKDFIPPDRKSMLDDWIWQIESIMLFLTRKADPENWSRFAGIAWYVSKHHLQGEADCLIPAFVEFLEGYWTNETDLNDPTEAVYACQALASIGPTAFDAIPILRRVAAATRFEELKLATAEALTVISPTGSRK